MESIFGLRQDCNSFSHQLHRYDRDSAERLSLEESYREECGCKKEEFVPCTVCPGGESVAYPDKEIVGIEGLGFDYLDLKCGTIDSRLLHYPTKKIQRVPQQGFLAKYAGAPYPKRVVTSVAPETPSLIHMVNVKWEWGSGRRIIMN